MLVDGEFDIGFLFNLGDVFGVIVNGELFLSVCIFVFDGGIVGNIYFVVVFFNSFVKEGVMIFVNYLLLLMV